MASDVEAANPVVQRSVTSLSPKRCLGVDRTPLERILMVLLLIMTSISAIMLVLLARPPTFTIHQAEEISEENFSSARTDEIMVKPEPYYCSGSQCQSICVTEACVKAAASILRNMDPSVHPCADFYSYACGQWKHHHVLPPDRPHYDTFAQMKDELKVLLKELLESPIDETDSNATANAKNLYASCLNESVIEKRREEPLLSLLKGLGSWPVITKNWTGESFDWLSLTAVMRQHSNDILFAQWVGADSKNSSANVIHVDQVDTGLPSREYYVRGTQQVEAYFKFMVDIAELLGAERNFAIREMEEVLKLESKLINLTIPNEQRRNFSVIYNKWTMEELQERIPLVNWTRYFNAVMPMELSPKEEVVVFAPQYLKRMSQLIDATPKRVVANYILWRFVSNRVGSLDKRFLAKQQEYFGAIYGTQSTPARWKTCTVLVNKNMGMAVGALFVHHHFNKQSKEKAEEMIRDIKSAFLEILDDVDWMDNETRQVARAKAELMSQKIGYPQYISDPEELDKEYEVEFERDTYFENIIKNLKHNAIKMQMKLKTGVDRTQWITYPAVVNAYYTRSKNFITFPAGVLQPPLYHKDFPRSVNYGGIGVIIGHEITHGFDDKGRQFDQHGNLKQWWKPEALERFQTKAQCMVDQYSRYLLPEVNMHVNGVNTQGENIADNGGVKQAFRAYKAHEQVSGLEPRLPGLNLTHDQLFFLTYAQIWCGTMRPEHAVNTIRTGSHSPGRFRVIGALSNSEDFARAYSCPRGSPMNPRRKCEVW
ncbi:neprilysin-1-like isoform X2 [Ornithodoros turicata]